MMEKEVFPIRNPLLNAWLRAVFFLIGWIVTAYAFSFLLVCVAMLPGFADLHGPLIGLVENLFSLAGTLLITAIFLRYFDKLPFKALGFQWKGHCAEMGFGLITGAVLIGTGVVCLLLLGQIELTKAPFDFQHFTCSLFMYIGVAFVEEIVFRGYILRNLMQACNKYAALILSSLVFALLHLLNDIEGDFIWFPVLQIFLAGILIGLPYIFTKNLWFSIAIHFSWNLVQGLIFGFAVSGGEVYSILQQQRIEDNLINGGAFGFEGSILSAILVVIACVPVFLIFRKKELIS